MASGLKFQIHKVEGLYFLFYENNGADQLRGYRTADVRLCFWHRLKPGFLMTRLNWSLSEPTVVPKDFRLDPTKPVEPHRAHFIWEAVDTSEQKIKGDFKGYKVHVG